jgi:hypothetical protein
MPKRSLAELKRVQGKPADVVAYVHVVDQNGSELDHGRSCELTRAMLEVFERAAARGLHGVGLHGVLQRALEDAARRIEREIGGG